MKIHRWSIEGFGLPRRSDSGNLPHGLAFIRAADEASKRALLGVVPSVLFGGDSAATTPLDRFPGRGWLILGSSDGEHRIEWDEATASLSRLVFPDGHVGSRADLRKLLHGADESLLRSVFVLNGEDLRCVDSLASDELGSQLSARITNGAEARAVAVANRLAARAAELLDSNGSGRIPQLIHDLSECRFRLAEAEAGEAEWVARYEEARRRTRELAQLEERASSCRARRQRSETLLCLWPQWQEMTAASERLRSLESIDEFPPEAGERLANLRDRLTEGAATTQRLRREKQQIERQQASAAHEDDLGPVAETVTRLQQELTSYRSRLMTLATARARHQECARELDRRLAEIGTGWGAKRAVRFDLESLKEDAVRAWAERMESVAGREREAQQDLERGQAELRSLCDSVAAELREDTPLAEDPLDEKWRALWRVRAHLDELWVVQSQGEAEARAVEEKEEALRKLDAKKGLPIPGMSTEPLGLLVGIGAILLLWRLSVGDMESAFLCAMVVGVLGVVRRAWSWRAQKVGVYERQLRQTAADKLAYARTARDARWKRAEEIRTALAHDSEVLGLREVPSVESVAECEQGLTSEGLGRRAEAGGGPRVNALVLQLLAAQEGELRLTETWRQRHEELRALRAEWEIWRASAGLPEGVAAERISEWVDAVRALKATWRAREQAAAEVKRLEPAISAWELKAREVLKQGRMPVAADLCGSALAERLTALGGRVRENEAAAAERRRLDEKLRDLTARLGEAEAAMKRDREERQVLLSEAGAQGDAELERRLQIFCERRELQARVEKLRQSIDTGLAEAEDGERLRASLAEDAGEDWSRDGAEAAIELGLIEERRRELADQVDSAESCWGALGEVPGLHGECSALQTELATAVQRWRRLVIAQALLRGSLEEVSRARVRAVLSEASRIFARLSGGRFQSVLPGENGECLLVVDADGRRHAVDAGLDRPTRENLYLSIRLGMAARAAERGARLPLVMDDVFAQLDPIRAGALISELQRLSQDRQVLVFTCDRTTCETVNQLGNGGHVVQA